VPSYPLLILPFSLISELCLQNKKKTSATPCCDLVLCLLGIPVDRNFASTVFAIFSYDHHRLSDPG
jgi:hypothetical protein